jgi:hypothetical protein
MSQKPFRGRPQNENDRDRLRALAAPVQGGNTAPLKQEKPAPATPKTTTKPK